MPYRGLTIWVLKTRHARCSESMPGKTGSLLVLRQTLPWSVESRRGGFPRWRSMKRAPARKHFPRNPLGPRNSLGAGCCPHSTAVTAQADRPAFRKKMLPRGWGKWHYITGTHAGCQTRCATWPQANPGRPENSGGLCQKGVHARHCHSQAPCNFMKMVSIRMVKKSMHSPPKL